MRSLREVREEIIQSVYKAGTRYTCRDGWHHFAGNAQHGDVAMPCDCSPAPVICPSCGGPMSLKTGRRGSFWSCKEYDPEDPNCCRGTLSCEEAQDQQDARQAMRIQRAREHSHV